MRPWDAAEHLNTEEDMAAYLEAALEEGDPALITAALGDIARAKGMTARERRAADAEALRCGGLYFGMAASAHPIGLCSR
jgi:probable addiction module antidote protein